MTTNNTGKARNEGHNDAVTWMGENPQSDCDWADQLKSSSRPSDALINAVEEERLAEVLGVVVLRDDDGDWTAETRAALEAYDAGWRAAIAESLGEVHVSARNARPSTCVTLSGAVDVDVTVTIGDKTISGEVTLAPQQYDGRLAAYGTAPDQWVSGALLQALRGLEGGAFTGALHEIEAAAAEVA